MMRRVQTSSNSYSEMRPSLTLICVEIRDLTNWSNSSFPYSCCVISRDWGHKVSWYQEHGLIKMCWCLMKLFNQALKPIRRQASVETEVALQAKMIPYSTSSFTIWIRSKMRRSSLMITNMKESHGAQLVVFRSLPKEPRRWSVNLLLTRSQRRNASITLLMLLLRIKLWSQGMRPK